MLLDVQDIFNFLKHGPDLPDPYLNQVAYRDDSYHFTTADNRQVLNTGLNHSLHEAGFRVIDCASFDPARHDILGQERLNNRKARIDRLEDITLCDHPFKLTTISNNDYRASAVLLH